MTHPVLTQGAVAVITGGASGIGMAAARAIIGAHGSPRGPDLLRDQPSISGLGLAQRCSASRSAITISRPLPATP